MAKVIMGIHVGVRVEDAVKVQQLLTENGCIIKTRIGLHEAHRDRNICSQKGLIILEFIEDAEPEITALEAVLKEIESVTVQKMVFGE